jgi:hypothetical protein
LIWSTNRPGVAISISILEGGVWWVVVAHEGVEIRCDCSEWKGMEPVTSPIFSVVDFSRDSKVDLTWYARSYHVFFFSNTYRFRDNVNNKAHNI